jgi:nucleoside 2-deoxyribosyltransferase
LNIYLICPVRAATFDASGIVAELESAGHAVHFPPRDVNQNSATGRDICDTHLAAMLIADAVYIVWDTESKGSHFDLGMAFALGKPVHLMHALQEDSAGKSYLKVIRSMETQSA